MSKIPVLKPDQLPTTPEDDAVSMTTGDLARQAGSTLRTVRFYEEAGLLQPVGRSDGGHRLYRPAELDKLRLILDLREAGLSLHDIRSLFELKVQASGPEQASRAMTEILGAQIDALQHKITALRRLREELASAVSVISECQACDHPGFPKRCGDCEVLSRPDLPRAVRLLWG